MITNGGKTFTVDLTGRTDTGCIIDSDAQIVTNSAGTEDLTGLSSGEFPVLGKGANTITGSGWSSLVSEDRYAYLS